MRPGRAIRVALGLCFAASLVVGCDSSSPSSSEKADTKPALKVEPEVLKQQKNKTTGKVTTKQDRMPHL
jgi:hypothetical protein